jgi:assimilatory nitrate reductase catalytic subunit
MSIIKSINDLLYQKKGPLTEELELAPAGSLGQMPKRLRPDGIISMVCGYCSTGCSLKVHIKDNEPVNLTPDLSYPVNFGEACPKGWEALTPLRARDRAARPYLREKGGPLRPVDWDTALQTFVGKFKDIQTRYGKDSVAFLSTGQICTEEMAFLGALAKFGMGMTHGDSNTRQCMATSAVAYKQSFGFDAPPYTYQDFEESDCLIFIGANPCIAHPIMWQRVCRNPHAPKIVVLDPRKTETAMAATHHYALLPKTDLTLLYGIAHLLIRKRWIDENFIKKNTNGFEEFREHVRSFDPKTVSAVTGLSVAQLEELVSLIHYGKRVSFWWTMGVNQGYEAVRTAQAIINLALMTGNIGRPGTGANSITGQCNAMGSRLFSNLTNLMGGYDFLNAQHREHVASILKIDVSVIPQENSMAYDEIIDAILRDKIKGLWIIATNPSHSWINRNEFRQIIRDKLEFLVVQDMYWTTETAVMADLILPAAGWGEKDGTVINSERRVGLFKKVSRSPGIALSDFNIFKLVAEYWGCREMFAEWDSPQAVFEILKRLSKGMPCDITGIRDYQMIDENGGIQWPLPEDTAVFEKERRLFEDGKFYHADQKAKFMFAAIAPHPEPVDHDYPLMLLTGRGTSSQWHTQTRTGKSAVLRKMYPRDAYVEINIEDARCLRVRQGDWVYVSTKRGQIKAQASVVPTVAQGQIFMPMHYPETNQLTLGVFDPYSRQPSYKICAARVSTGQR